MNMRLLVVLSFCTVFIFCATGLKLNASQKHLHKELSPSFLLQLTTPEEQLRRAVRRGDIPKIKEFFHKKIGDGVLGSHFLARRAFKAPNTAEVLSVLHELGYDIDLPNALWNRTSHIAAQNGNLEVLILLHELGYNVDIKNLYGKTPFDFAEQMGETSCMDYIRKLRTKGCF